MLLSCVDLLCQLLGLCSGFVSEAAQSAVAAAATGLAGSRVVMHPGQEQSSSRDAGEWKGKQLGER